MSVGDSNIRGRGVADALKLQPLTLALVVVVLIFMYFVYSGVQANRKEINDVLKVMVEQNAKAQELLSRCIVPPDKG